MTRWATRSWLSWRAMGWTLVMSCGRLMHHHPSPTSLSTEQVKPHNCILLSITKQVDMPQLEFDFSSFSCYHAGFSYAQEVETRTQTGARPACFVIDEVAPANQLSHPLCHYQSSDTWSWWRNSGMQQAHSCRAQRSRICPRRKLCHCAFQILVMVTENVRKAQI